MTVIPKVPRGEGVRGAWGKFPNNHLGVFPKICKLKLDSLIKCTNIDL